MNVAFYIAGTLAVISTAMVITRTRAIHALLYLIVSLLALAVVFYLLGAPFIAALEVIIYAGAIMVLFLFAVMLLNLGPRSARQEREWLRMQVWWGPGLVSLGLLAVLVYVVSRGGVPAAPAMVITPKQVGISLLGPYILGVELASILLLAGLVAAHRLTRDEASVDGPGGRLEVSSGGSQPAEGTEYSVSERPSDQPVGESAASSGRAD